MREAALCLLCLCLLPACRNAPAEEREELRYRVGVTPPSEVEARRAELTEILLGGQNTPRDEDPHLRAVAAQGLGELGYAEDSEVLMDALAGPPSGEGLGSRITSLADGSTQVRMECAIALGKLYYAGVRDRRRIEVINVLKARIVRDPGGARGEAEFMVRTAMLNSLIALGGRRAAIAIHDVATRLQSDLASGPASITTTATDKGLLDRCFEGLCILTGVSPQVAAQHRVEHDNLGAHVAWWTERIRDMPDN
jgi:hypothetical protein